MGAQDGKEAVCESISHILSFSIFERGERRVLFSQTSRLPPPSHDSSQISKP
jgi:hypothetical protein